MFKLIVSLLICFLVYRLIQIKRASKNSGEGDYKRSDDSDGVVIDAEIVDDDK